MASLIRRMQSGVVSLRVHDVIIKGNNKTKDYIIEAEVEALKNAITIQDLLRVSSAVNMRLQALKFLILWPSGSTLGRRSYVIPPM
ncbi:hypothetical protein SLA2020_157910 [Shorea laevis]